MPKWIHDRAAHIRAKNPEMSEGQSWAIATQQSHVLKKTPKTYGTKSGRKTATRKYSGGTKSWVSGADPKKIGAKLVAKEKSAMELSDMPTSYEMAKLGGFSDELRKIAAPASGAIGRTAKAFGEALAGGPRKDPGILARGLGKLKGTKVLGERTGTLKNLRSKDKALRGAALKTLGARGTVGTAAVAGTAKATKEHRKTERRQLGRAYVAGARDMYSRTRRG